MFLAQISWDIELFELVDLFFEDIFKMSDYLVVT